MSEYITKNFKMEEFLVSSTADKKGIDNKPTLVAKNNIRFLVKLIMQPIRDKWGDSIVITSGYRCPMLNKAVGGSSTSQHITGSACDFKAKTKKQNKELFEMIKDMIEKGEITCGQFIWEKGSKDCPDWLHISLPMQNKKNQILYLGVK